MKRERMEQLRRLYEAPKPVGKRAFFRKMEQRPISISKMLWLQCACMPKWEWILAICVFAVILTLSHTGPQWMWGMALAMMPFLAVTGVSKSIRSVTYGMNELEQAARFSLKSIVLARMGIVGVENLVLTILFAAAVGEGIFQTALYLLIPYLVTTYGSLILVRKMPGKEGVYTCAGLAAFVIMAEFIVYMDYSWTWIFQVQYVYLWLLAAFILLALVVKESNRVVGTLEAITV